MFSLLFDHVLSHSLQACRSDLVKKQEKKTKDFFKLHTITAYVCPQPATVIGHVLKGR